MINSNCYNNIADFDFDLPKELIANHPISVRDNSRLLSVSSNGILKDLNFHNIIDLLKEGDVLVFNDTKVLSSRLLGLRLAKDKLKSSVKDSLNFSNIINTDIPELLKNELFTFNLAKLVDQSTWDVLVKGAKKFKPGDIILFLSHDNSHTNLDCYLNNKETKFLFAEVIGRNDMFISIRFNLKGNELFDAINSIGEMPIPPYIKRSPDFSDKESYQTVYAAKYGSVAAPTAGLHFTPNLLEKLDNKGVIRVPLTLHVGAGTFLPIKEEKLDNHVMHSEWYNVSLESIIAISKAKKENRRVICVGSTSIRVTESLADIITEKMKNSAENYKVNLQQEKSYYSGETDIFIKPGYKFKIADALITNFHLPRSTLFVLTAAFCGHKIMHQAYKHAIEQRYRFFSYGDACFLEKENI